MSDDDSESEQDRRRHERRIVCIPVSVETEAAATGQKHNHYALISDISKSGALLLMRRRPEVGALLELKLDLGRLAGGVMHDVEAEVVRADPLDLERADLWKFTVAVRFLEPLTGIDDALADIAKRLERA